MNVFLQHFTCFSQVFVNLGRVKISQIPYKSYICQSIRQYLLSDSCSNKESDTREFWLSPQLRCFAACSGFQRVGPATRNLWGDGRFAYTHSGAASQLAVGFGRSVPLCGTCGEMGGLLCPTAALLRSLQWVSDSRSRVAEPMGRWGIARPTAALLRSLQWVSEGRSRYAEPMGRWEVCYAPQRRCFAACSGFQIVGPAMRNLWGDGRVAYTHSGAASQLAVGF